jgi:hypothetical protein
MLRKHDDVFNVAMSGQADIRRAELLAGNQAPYY